MKSGIKYRHIVRPVKYPRIEFKSGELEVIAPKNADIPSLLIRHHTWVNEKLRFIEKNSRVKKKELEERTDKELDSYIRRCIRRAEKLLNVQHSYYRFRTMKTKWATCSSRGVITYNRIVTYLPNELIWYITLHEMAHLIVVGHNKKFWHLVSKHIKGPEEYERKLYSYWFTIYKN